MPSQTSPYGTASPAAFRPREPSAPDGAACPGLTLVLPAYNEAHAIAHSVRDAAAALDGLGIPYEILVVDDGSTDETAAIAGNVARELPHVRVVSLEKNAGYGAALRHGFREATYELLAFTDADGQFDLRELDRLLPLAQDFDLVCGYRIDRQDHWTRILYSRGYNLLVRTLLGTRVRDCDCALKIFRRQHILAMNLESTGFFFNAELLTKARLAGHTVTEVGVSHFPRLRGESKVSILHVFPVFLTLLRFWWSKALFSRPDPAVKISVRGGARWAAGILLAVSTSSLILPRLSYPLIDPDESRYAEIAREMLESGDFVVPTRFGKPYLDKPPLLYWLTAASYSQFGVSESSARLVPAGAAMLTVLATYVLGARLLGYAAAWLGGLAMLSCLGFLISGRFVFIDTLLTLCTTVTLLTGYLAGRRGNFNLWWWSASAVGCALGVLAKGPVAGVLCLPPLLASGWLTGSSAIRLKHWALFGAMVGLVSLPWFFLVNARQPEFLADFFWRHHVNRFVEGLSHTEPWWYYVPVFLVGMLPCSMLFPATAAFLSDRGGSTLRWRTWDVGFMVLTVLWTVVFFSGSSCKLPPYLLPSIPFACLVVGRALESILSGTVEKPFLRFVRQRSPQHLILFMIVSAGIVGLVDVMALNGREAGRGWHWVGLVSVGSLLAVASPLGLVRRGLVPWGVTGLLAVLSMGMAMLDFYPGVATLRSKVSPVIDLCHDDISHSTPVICYSLAHEADSLAFQLGLQQVQNYEAAEIDAMVAALHQSPEVVVVAGASGIAPLLARLPSDITLVERGQYQHIVVSVCTSRASVADRR
jgi:4-amino-4-deoxy-L-arabinose transferase-like glycosyltransferase